MPPEKGVKKGVYLRIMSEQAPVDPELAAQSGGWVPHPEEAESPWTPRRRRRRPHPERACERGAAPTGARSSGAPPWSSSSWRPSSAQLPGFATGAGVDLPPGHGGERPTGCGMQASLYAEHGRGCGSRGPQRASGCSTLNCRPRLFCPPFRLPGWCQPVARQVDVTAGGASWEGIPTSLQKEVRP